MVPVKLKTLLGREVISIGPNKWIIRAKNPEFYYLIDHPGQYWNSLLDSSYCTQTIGTLYEINKHHGITSQSIEEAINEINQSSKSS